MHLKELTEKALQSEIIKLMYGGKTLGLRAKVFNVDDNVFEYYDFDLELLHKSRSLYNYLSNNSSVFSSEKLISKDGRLYTSSEIKGDIHVDELTDLDTAVKILQPVVILYERGYKDNVL